MVVSPQHLGEVPGDHVVHDAHDLAVNLLTMVTEVLGGGEGEAKDRERNR